MSFARRRKAKPEPGKPDLPVLLAEMSARQGSSRTAMIQSRQQSAMQTPATDPILEIFAPSGQPVAATHRFSDQILSPVMPRKLT